MRKASSKGTELFPSFDKIYIIEQLALNIQAHPNQYFGSHHLNAAQIISLITSLWISEHPPSPLIKDMVSNLIGESMSLLLWTCQISLNFIASTSWLQTFNAHLFELLWGCYNYTYTQRHRARFIPKYNFQNSKIYWNIHCGRIIEFIVEWFRYCF